MHKYMRTQRTRTQRCIHAHMHAYNDKDANTHAHAHTAAYTHTYMLTKTHRLIHTRTHTHARTHTDTYTHTHTHTHTCLHTQRRTHARTLTCPNGSWFTAIASAFNRMAFDSAANGAQPHRYTRANKHTNTLAAQTVCFFIWHGPTAHAYAREHVE